MNYEDDGSWLKRFTEFVDVLGRHGTPFALVILGFIIIYLSLFSGQSISVSPNHFAGMIIGTVMIFTGVIFEYKKMQLKEKRLSKKET